MEEEGAGPEGEEQEGRGRTTIQGEEASQSTKGPFLSPAGVQLQYFDEKGTFSTVLYSRGKKLFLRHQS